MSNQWDHFLGVFMLGCLLTFIVLLMVITAERRPIRKLITDCEQALPRDKQCELFAQPIEDMGR